MNRQTLFVLLPGLLLASHCATASFVISGSTSFVALHHRQQNILNSHVSLNAAEGGQEGEDDDIPSDVGVVLLAGGTGSRMKASMPKQFLPLAGKPILHHTLSLFLDTLHAKKVALVLDPMYHTEYQPFIDKYGEENLAFANPGEERQGSVENGMKKLIDMADGDSCKYVAVHDSARPLVTPTEIHNVISDAKEYGAAVLGVPCKATIKESEDGLLVKRTIPRERLWEVHTPQVIKIGVLQEGFEKVAQKGWEVTDDVSIVEMMGLPVKLTLGEYTNLKITTPEDMEVAEAILVERRASASSEKEKVAT